ncbi:hypothetical protein [Henriciella sp.]|uniref:hypothetical protein n=1 Tax=Henriciella sp. TaxID=1968823 RepID=UPI002637AEB8|nr:hypothetical protein [Henriciella sp.]
MKPVAIFLLACLVTCLPASADRVEEAFDAGRFLEAAEAARTLGGPDNEARAARALLADVVVSSTPAPERLDEAERLARKALEAEPRHIEARLQLAFALSLKSRWMSTSEALDRGYGGTARDLVTSVLEDDPDNVYGNGFMAVWNIEVMRRGGRLGAVWMGASMNKARSYYAHAIESGASSPSLHWQYARALATLNADKYRDDIMASLERAGEARAPTALDALMQTRARSFMDYMRTHSPREAEAAAVKLF